MAVDAILGPGDIPGFAFSDDSDRRAKMFAASVGVYDFGKTKNVRQVHVLSGSMQLNGVGMSANFSRAANIKPDEEFRVVVFGPRDVVFAIYPY